MPEAPSEMLDYLQSELSEEVIMASRRCPHCKAISTYDTTQAHIGGGSPGTLNLGRESGLNIRLDRCRNEDCLGSVAVIFDGEGKEIEIFPALEEEPAENLPPDVEVAFSEALKAQNEGVWNGCVMMAVRALAEATTNLEAKGDSLYAKIENLAETHRITPALAGWAHEGRLAANLGRHGDEKKKDEKKWNDRSDAEEIVEFSKWFFRYVYTLPAQLKERKARLEAEAKQRDEHTDEADRETPEPSPEES